jgi:hypothetical protein
VASVSEGGYGQAQCVVCTKERQASIGHLCAGHFARLAEMLREIEAEACHLDARPSMQQTMDSGGGTLPSHRSPARLDVLVHTDRRRGTGKSETDDDALAAGSTLPILDVLGSWARLVREDRELSWPREVTVTGERDFLTRQLDWIAAQDWVDEMFSDVRQLLGQLRIANDHTPDKPHCRCPVIADGEVCRGSVWVHDEMQPVWRRYPDRCSRTWEQAPGSAVCDTCGSSWKTDGDKARLKRMVDDQAAEDARPKTEDGQRMLTAQELVEAGLARSAHSVRKAASRAGVLSVRGHYDPDLFDKATA